MIETAPGSENSTSHRGRAKTVIRLSWLVIALLSIVLLLIPPDFGANLGSSVAGVLVVVSTFCGIWFALTLSAVTLIVAHANSFRRTPALLGIAALFGVLLWLWALQSQPDGQGASLLANLQILIGSWVLILPLALGVAVGVHLWLSDNAISLAAGTLLTLVWSLVVYVRLNSAERLLASTLSGSDVATIWWFQPIICLTFWILLLGSVSFLGHTLRLLHQECKG